MRKIEDGKVNLEWPGLFASKRVPLAEAISSIKSTLDAQAKAPQFSLIAALNAQKSRTWKVEPQAKVGARLMNQAELEEWLRTLPVGAKVSLEISDVLWKPGQNASRKEIDNLQMFAHAFGLEFRIIPGG